MKDAAKYCPKKQKKTTTLLTWHHVDKGVVTKHLFERDLNSKWAQKRRAASRSSTSTAPTAQRWWHQILRGQRLGFCSPPPNLFAHRRASVSLGKCERTSVWFVNTARDDITSLDFGTFGLARLHVTWCTPAKSTECKNNGPVKCEPSVCTVARQDGKWFALTGVPNCWYLTHSFRRKKLINWMQQNPLWTHLLSATDNMLASVSKSRLKSDAEFTSKPAASWHTHTETHTHLRRNVHNESCWMGYFTATVWRLLRWNSNVLVTRLWCWKKVLCSRMHPEQTPPVMRFFWPRGWAVWETGTVVEGPQY